jgi:hypothetical protein
LGLTDQVVQGIVQVGLDTDVHFVPSPIRETGLHQICAQDERRAKACEGKIQTFTKVRNL